MADTAKKAAPKPSTTAAKKPAAAAPKQAAAAPKSKATAAKVVEMSSKAATTANKSAARAQGQTASPAEAAKQPAAAPKNAPPAPGVISEAELLKMPEKDYMNEVQLAFFKARLLAMREEILSNARETGEHLKENEVFADPNDRATVEEENMLEQRVRDRERKLLKKIEQSLARIESGEYGYCLETGEPIGIPRLLARPTAELSIEAQEKHERREKLYAD